MVSMSMRARDTDVRIVNTPLFRFPATGSGRRVSRQTNRTCLCRFPAYSPQRESQPRAPLPVSWGVRVALQISVWACAGAARASSEVAASRARQARWPGPCVRFPASQRRRALGRAPAPAARPSGSEAHKMSVSHSLTSRPAPGPDRTIPAAKAPGALRATCPASPAVRTQLTLVIMAHNV